MPAPFQGLLSDIGFEKILSESLKRKGIPLLVFRVEIVPPTLGKLRNRRLLGLGFSTCSRPGWLGEPEAKPGDRDGCALSGFGSQT